MNSSATPQSTFKPTLLVESFSASLQPKMLVGLIGLQSPSWRLIYVEDGRVTVMSGDTTRVLEGPMIAWVPWHEEYRLRADAGSVGLSVLLGEDELASAIGHKPESTDLRLLAQNSMEIDLYDLGSVQSESQNAFETMRREFRDGAPGAETIIEAQIRVLLVIFWRHVAALGRGVNSQSRTVRALQTFRQLVEAHFRDRWRVEDYAQALGMTRDRLHDICIRNLNKPPSQLLHERTTAEAVALLLRSSQTIDQISDFLGFPATPHFSRFFQRMIGVPPGAFRRDALSGTPDDGKDIRRSYADWP